MKKPSATTRYGVCISCGRETSLSQNDLCLECGLERINVTNRELQRKEGEMYEKWKKGIRKAVRKERSDKGKRRK